MANGFSELQEAFDLTVSSFSSPTKYGYGIVAADTNGTLLNTKNNETQLGGYGIRECAVDENNILRLGIANSSGENILPTGQAYITIVIPEFSGLRITLWNLDDSISYQSEEIDGLYAWMGTKDLQTIRILFHVRDIRSTTLGTYSELYLNGIDQYIKIPKWVSRSSYPRITFRTKIEDFQTKRNILGSETSVNEVYYDATEKVYWDVAHNDDAGTSSLTPDTTFDQDIWTKVEYSSVGNIGEYDITVEDTTEYQTGLSNALVGKDGNPPIELIGAGTANSPTDFFKGIIRDISLEDVYGINDQYCMMGDYNKYFFLDTPFLQDGAVGAITTKIVWQPAKDATYWRLFGDTTNVNKNYFDIYNNGDIELNHDGVTANLPGALQNITPGTVLTIGYTVYLTGIIINIDNFIYIPGGTITGTFRLDSVGYHPDKSKRLPENAGLIYLAVNQSGISSWGPTPEKGEVVKPDDGGTGSHANVLARWILNESKQGFYTFGEDHPKILDQFSGISSIDMGTSVTYGGGGPEAYDPQKGFKITTTNDSGDRRVYWDDTFLGNTNIDTEGFTLQYEIEADLFYMTSLTNDHLFFLQTPGNDLRCRLDASADVFRTYNDVTLLSQVKTNGESLDANSEFVTVTISWDPNYSDNGRLEVFINRMPFLSALLGAGAGGAGNYFLDIGGRSSGSLSTPDLYIRNVILAEGPCGFEGTYRRNIIAIGDDTLVEGQYPRTDGSNVYPITGYEQGAEYSGDGSLDSVVEVRNSSLFMQLHEQLAKIDVYPNEDGIKFYARKGTEVLTTNSLPLSERVDAVTARVQSTGPDFPAGGILYEGVDVALISVGKNDVKYLGENPGEDATAYIANAMAELKVQIDRLVDECASEIVLMNCPPLYQDNDPADPGPEIYAAITQEWNAAVNNHLAGYKGIVKVCDVYKDYTSSLSENDGLLPNYLGFNFLAKRISSVVNGGKSSNTGMNWKWFPNNNRHYKITDGQGTLITETVSEKHGTLMNAESLGGGWDYVIPPPPPARMTFFAPLQNTLAVSVSDGSGVPTFTRTSEASVIDFEGLIRSTKTGEARFAGARRVENLLTGSEALDQSPWTVFAATRVAGVADPDGGTSAVTLTATGGNGYITQTVNGVNGTVCNSVWVRRRTGTGQVRFAKSDASGGDVLNLTSSWQRFNSSDRLFRTNGVLRIVIVTSGDEIDVAFPQMETVDGQANQNPSEYVSTGILSAPFYGANVDGVKYFITKNGNTVSSNIVTEATGAVIGEAAYYSDPKGPFGYISESSRTNYITYSEDYSNALWGKTNTVVNSGILAPDGTNTAYQLIDDNLGGAAICEIRYNSVDPGGDIACFSIYVKKDQLDWIRLYAHSFDTSQACYYDLANGKIGSATGVDEGIEYAGNDWYKCWFTFDTAVDSIGNIRLQLANDSGDVTVDRDGTSSLYIWGAQLETGSFPSTYIKTEGSTVSRQPDALTYPDTDNIQDAAGTALFEISTFWDISEGANYAIARDYSGRIFYCNGGFTANRGQAYDATNIRQLAGTGPSLEGYPQEIATAWGDNLAIYNDTDIVSGAYDGTMGVGDIEIGNRGSGLQWNGTLRNIKIHNTEDHEIGISAPDPLLFQLDLQSSIISESANGDDTPTFTRASEATVVDFDNIIRTTKTSETRFIGSRRVENRFAYSEDLLNSAWQTINVGVGAGVPDPDGGNNAYTITATSAGAQFRQASLSPAGGIAQTSMWIRRRIGTGDVSFHQGNGGIIAIPITGTWQRMAINIADLKTTGSGDAGLYFAASGDAVDIYQPQVEGVEGSSNQAPGEYVPTDKSISLGSEAVINGTFDSDITNWVTHGGSITHEWDNNRLKITASGTWNGTKQTITMVPGRNYRVSVDYILGTSTEVAISFDTETNFGTAPSGTIEYVFTASTTSAELRLTTGNQTGTAWFDNVTVKEEYFHGANADGVKYFTTENGNSVSSNVVTEATGVTIDGIVEDLWDYPSAVLGPNWTVFDEVYSHTAGTAGNVTCGVLTIGQRYRMTITVTNYVSGQVRARLGSGGPFSDYLTSNGTISVEGIALGSTSAQLQTVTADFEGDVTLEVGLSQLYADTAGPHGYLSETNSTNLIVRSQELDHASWSPGQAVVDANVTTAPDGTNTADRVKDDNAGGQGACYLNMYGVTVTATDHCLSVYAKADGENWINIRSRNFDSNLYCYYDLANGVIGTSNATAEGMEYVGNGWYRCWMVFSPSADLTGDFRLYVSAGDLDDNVDRDDSSSAFFWGVQLEDQPYPSTYIKTEAAAVTRLNDVLKYSITDNVPQTYETTYSFTSTRYQLAHSSAPQNSPLCIGDYGPDDWVGLGGYSSNASTMLGKMPYAWSLNQAIGGAYTLGVPLDLAFTFDGRHEWQQYWDGTPQTAVTNDALKKFWGADNMYVGTSYTGGDGNIMHSVRHLKIYQKKGEGL